MIERLDHEELVVELVALDRRIKELRKVRSAATYDLEHAIKEQDRIKRHLRSINREER